MQSWPITERRSKPPKMCYRIVVLSRQVSGDGGWRRAVTRKPKRSSGCGVGTGSIRRRYPGGSRTRSTSRTTVAIVARMATSAKPAPRQT